MGFDTWGPDRRPRPPKPSTANTVTADLAKRQRADDRRIPGAGTNSRAQDFGTFAIDSTLVLDGSGYGSSTWTLPTAHKRYAWHAQVNVDVDAGTDADLWVQLADGGIPAMGYGKQPPSGLAYVGAGGTLITAGGTGVGVYIDCPLAAGASATVQFSCYPLAG